MASDWKIVGRLKFSRSGELGSGGYGTVYKGKFDGKEVAVKMIQLDSQERSDIKAELHFVQFGKDSWHENLVRNFHKEKDENFL